MCKGGAGGEGGDGAGARAGAGTLQDGADRTDTDRTEEQADIDSFPEKINIKETFNVISSEH